MVEWFERGGAWVEGRMVEWFEPRGVYGLRGVWSHDRAGALRLVE
jgi:hypothetical protein